MSEKEALAPRESDRNLFVSYASADAALANSIVETLEKNRVRCWIAPRDVVPGSLYADGIVRAINETQFFVLVLSKHALSSKHVGKELERASSKGHPIFAIRTDTAPLTPAFEYFLSESQWIDVGRDGVDAAVTKLVAAMRNQPTTHGAVSHSPPVLPKTRRWPMFLGGIAVLAALGGLLIALWPASKPAQNAQVVSTTPTPVSETKPISEKSIAVLPFTDMSEKKDQEYLADGMAEEILNLLAQAPDLLVSARTSSFYFKGKQTKIPDIARELGVAHVLEGSVRKSGDHLRVTAQLVRADNGYHLWSETFDRDLKDVFKVQDEIANAVVQALQIKLMGGELSREKGGTQNLAAYQLYLHGLTALYQNTKPALDRAAAYFDDAIKLDPNYGLALSGRAFMVVVATDNGFLPDMEGYERARQMALRALEVSPSNPNSYTVLQYVYRALDRDWAASEQAGRRALALDPTNVNALMFMGMLYSTLGRWDDAVQRLRSAYVRDPLNSFAIFNLGEAYYLAGRYVEAEGMLRKLLEVAPEFSWTRAFLGKTLLAQGRTQDALEVVEQDNNQQMQLLFLPIILQAAGRTAEASEALKAQIEKQGETGGAYYVAMTYAYRGDRDLAFQWLDRAFQERNHDLVEVVGESLLRNIRDDQRFAALLRKMNLPQLATRES